MDSSDSFICPRRRSSRVARSELGRDALGSGSPRQRDQLGKAKSPTKKPISLVDLCEAAHYDQRKVIFHNASRGGMRLIKTMSPFGLTMLVSAAHTGVIRPATSSPEVLPGSKVNVLCL